MHDDRESALSGNEKKNKDKNFQTKLRKNDSKPNMEKETLLDYVRDPSENQPSVTCSELNYSEILGGKEVLHQLFLNRFLNPIQILGNSCVDGGKSPAVPVSPCH